MPFYAELHSHSYFSLLDGASSPEALVTCAAGLGMKALALTDHDAVYGAVRFERAARERGLHPVHGAELTLVGGHHLTLLVENESGWHNLCYLISCAQHNAPKGSALLPLEALIDHTAGLVALSGCRRGAIPSALLAGDWTGAHQFASLYYELFGRGRFYIELQHHYLPDDTALVYKLVTLARRIGVPYVATNNVHYTTPDGQPLQDVLTCIRHGETLDNAKHLRPNAEYYLKSGEAMARLFASLPAALKNTVAIAERCRFSLRYGLQDLPAFPLRDGYDVVSYLRELCEGGAHRLLGEVPNRARDLLNRELEVIARAGLANYFLIVWDLVRFARENGILCQGRGSAANSLVAYLLGISPVNPLAHDLVFERFLSEERAIAPDIDIDFQADRREEVIQYAYGRYGHDYAAMACTLVTFRERSAIREVGKVLGLPPEVIDHAANAHHGRNKGALEQSFSVEGFNRHSSVWAQFEQLYPKLIDLPRHLGIHNGGMIITGTPLARRLPTEPATMPDRVVVQWDKDSLEEAGLIKIDILGLRMLSLIAEASAHVARITGTPPDLESLRPDDPAVYDMICRADTVGVFQVESRAQQQVLPRMRPRVFNDLIVSISLIRPGPMQGNMVHPYLRRRFGEESVSYPHPLLEPSLRETLGVILFQEQVLKVARDLGGFTAGQGEQLRRALGKKNHDEAVARFEAAFIAGAEKNCASSSVAREVFGQLKAFGGYSFPKSHAAAFAVLVYRSAWLKCHYPVAFYTALLNHQPMGFWSPAVIVNDARRHGIPILPVGIHTSAANCTVENGGIRLGLRYVKGLGDTGSARIVEARQDGAFTNLADFCRRTTLSRHLVENLIRVGAMDVWGIPQRQLLWQLGEIQIEDNPLGLEFHTETVELPPLTRAEMLYAEYEILSLSSDDHVMTLYRDSLESEDILDSTALSRTPSGTKVRIAGLVVMHQAPPTAKEHHFITLEDEWGLMNIIVRPDVYANYRQVWRDAPLIVVEGYVQRKGDVVNVIAMNATALATG
jgi:error-prone DNA polymerase